MKESDRIQKEIRKVFRDRDYYKRCQLRLIKELKETEHILKFYKDRLSKYEDVYNDKFK